MDEIDTCITTYECFYSVVKHLQGIPKNVNKFGKEWLGSEVR